MDNEPQTMSNQDGWICCCNGAIADPRRPFVTMTCCGNYVWSGTGQPTLPHPRDRSVTNMSNDSQTTIQQHADRLRQLGFPEKVIEEVVQAYSRGLFDMKPSPDLIARVIDQYRKSRMTESNGQHTGGSIA